MTDALADSGAMVALQPLFMIRAEVVLPEFRRWMGIRRLQDADHAMHCLLAESFGELAPRPFRLIMPRGEARGVLYGYARAEDGALRDAADIYADPSQARILPADRIASKPMPLVWQAGKRLGFETRIRPIVRRSRNADCRPRKECDAFALEASRYPEGDMPCSRETGLCRLALQPVRPARRCSTPSRPDKAGVLPAHPCSPQAARPLQ